MDANSHDRGVDLDYPDPPALRDVDGKGLGGGARLDALHIDRGIEIRRTQAGNVVSCGLRTLTAPARVQKRCNPVLFSACGNGWMPDPGLGGHPDMDLRIFHILDDEPDAKSRDKAEACEHPMAEDTAATATKKLVGGSPRRLPAVVAIAHTGTPPSPLRVVAGDGSRSHSSTAFRRRSSATCVSLPCSATLMSPVSSGRRPRVHRSVQ